MFQHVLRKKVDVHNDVLVFATLATHQDEPFDMREKLNFKVHYESSIIPIIEDIIDFDNKQNNIKDSL